MLASTFIFFLPLNKPVKAPTNPPIGPSTPAADGINCAAALNSDCTSAAPPCWIPLIMVVIALTSPAPAQRIRPAVSCFFFLSGSSGNVSGTALGSNPPPPPCQFSLSVRVAPVMLFSYVHVPSPFQPTFCQVPAARPSALFCILPMNVRLR